MSNELFAALIAGSLAGGGGGSTETDDYNNLKNKPKINGTKLEGNLSLSDIGAATSDQGDKADSAVQPEDLGSAATADTSDFATAAQGGKADSAIQGIKVNSTTVNPDGNKVVNITVPTSAADVSALPDTTKYAAALRLTINSSTFVVTGQLIDQDGNDLGTAQTIDLPLESVVVDGSYNSQTKKVVLTLQNGNTIEFSVADLVSGLQTELSASNKLNPAYINYDSTHRAVSDTEKSTWNGKQSALTTAQLTAVNSGIDSTKVAQIATNEANISTLTPTVKDSGNTFTVGTDYTLCDACTLTVPAPSSGAKAAHILAGLAFNSTAPRGIIISLSNDISDFNTSSKLLAKVESSDFIRLTAECFYYNYGSSNVNIYVWAKSSTSGVNRVVSSMQLLN